MKVIYNLVKRYYSYLNQQINKFDRLTISALLLTVATIITIINFILIFQGLNKAIIEAIAETNEKIKIIFLVIQIDVLSITYRIYFDHLLLNKKYHHQKTDKCKDSKN